MWQDRAAQALLCLTSDSGLSPRTSVALLRSEKTMVPASVAAAPEERIEDSTLDELDNLNGDILIQHQNRCSLCKTFAVDDKKNMDLERIIRVGDVHIMSDDSLRA
jgi:hypothetical protein